MNSNFITRSKIDSIVEHKIDEMSKDPESALKSLEQIVHRFSFGHFQIPVFSVIDHLLANQDSSYYFMIQRILEQTSHSAIKNLGILLGYNSWTYGAKLLRSTSEKLGYCIPWNITFRWDPSRSDKMNLKHIKRLVADGNKLGIYSFTIRQEVAMPIPGELFDLFADHSDCIFFWMLPDQPLAPIHFHMLEETENVLVFFEGNGTETVRNVQLTKEHHTLYGIHYTYSEDDTPYLFSDRMTEYFPFYDSLFVVMIADDSCPQFLKDRFSKYAYSIRTDQNLPFILLDYYSDLMRINNLISGKQCIMEFSSEGDLLQPVASSFSENQITSDLHLNWYLASYMPPLIPPKTKQTWRNFLEKIPL